MYWWLQVRGGIVSQCLSLCSFDNFVTALARVTQAAVLFHPHSRRHGDAGQLDAGVLHPRPGRIGWSSGTLVPAREQQLGASIITACGHLTTRLLSLRDPASLHESAARDEERNQGGVLGQIGGNDDRRGLDGVFGARTQT